VIPGAWKIDPRRSSHPILVPQRKKNSRPDV
jgi:hypothetical protein